jgi:hypothetical protein
MFLTNLASLKNADQYKVEMIDPPPPHMGKLGVPRAMVTCALLPTWGPILQLSAHPGW